MCKSNPINRTLQKKKYPCYFVIEGLCASVCSKHVLDVSDERVAVLLVTKELQVSSAQSLNFKSNSQNKVFIRKCSAADLPSEKL